VTVEMHGDRLSVEARWHLHVPPATAESITPLADLLGDAVQDVGIIVAKHAMIEQVASHAHVVDWLALAADTARLRTRLAERERQREGVRQQMDDASALDALGHLSDVRGLDSLVGDLQQALAMVTPRLAAAERLAQRVVEVLVDRAIARLNADLDQREASIAAEMLSRMQGGPSDGVDLLTASASIHHARNQLLAGAATMTRSIMSQLMRPAPAAVSV
jgi:hypothetical protein